MSNVVYVDFRNKQSKTENSDFDLDHFVRMLMKYNIDEDDIQEVIESIYDPTKYQTVDEDIRKLADAYIAVSG